MSDVNDDLPFSFWFKDAVNTQNLFLLLMMLWIRPLSSAQWYWNCFWSTGESTTNVELPLARLDFLFSSWLFLCCQAFFAEPVASSWFVEAFSARDPFVPLSVWVVSLTYSHTGYEFSMPTSTWLGRRQIWGKGARCCNTCGKSGVKNLRFSSQFHSYKVLWSFGW